MQHLAAHDREGFLRRYAELAPALHVWAMLRINSTLRSYCEAEDLLQEVWCRACMLENRHAATGTEFRPWLFRIAKNVLLEVARKARYAGRVQQAAGSTSRLLRLEGVLDDVTSITRRVARDDALREFHQRILALADDERELLVHVGLEGLGYAAAATRLGLSPAAVNKRWQRLRARLTTQGLPATLLEP